MDSSDKNRGTRSVLISIVVVLLTVVSSAVSPGAFAWDTSCCGAWIHFPEGAGFARNGPTDCIGFVNQAPESQRPAQCKKYEAAVKSRDNGKLCPELLNACNACKPFSGKPSPDALNSWNKMVQVSGANSAADQQAIDRFLESPEGVQLEEQLQQMFCSHPDKSCWPRIRISFGAAGYGEGGHVAEDQYFPNPFNPKSEDPAAWQKFFYGVTITQQRDSIAPPPHFWPGEASAACIGYYFSSGASEMATAIYHELLHIWWMNHFQTIETGHGADASNCSAYEPGFMQKLKDFYGDMDAQDQCQRIGSANNPVSSPPSSPAPKTHP